MIQISFVVPVYNTQDYVSRCLQSICSQITDEALCELIVVNDGSTDNSLSIIETFAKQHNYVHIIDQVNMGVGAARNTALEVAQGKYIYFVDSDDYLLPNTLDSLLNATNTHYDMIGFNWQTLTTGGKFRIHSNQKFGYNQQDTGVNYMLKQNFAPSVWYFLFNTAFLKKQALKMPEGIYHEDDLFLTQALIYAHSLMFVDVCVYAYCKRANSITENKSKSHLEQRIKDCLYVLQQLTTLGLQPHIYATQHKALRRKIDFFVVDIIRNAICFGLDKATINKSLSQIRLLHLFPLNKVNYSFKYKVFRLCFRTNAQVYILAWLNSLFRLLVSK